jgi:hypothetical protein
MRYAGSCVTSLVPSICFSPVSKRAWPLTSKYLLRCERQWVLYCVRIVLGPSVNRIVYIVMQYRLSVGVVRLHRVVWRECKPPIVFKLLRGGSWYPSIASVPRTTHRRAGRPVHVVGVVRLQYSSTIAIICDTYLLQNKTQSYGNCHVIILLEPRSGDISQY